MRGVREGKESSWVGFAEAMLPMRVIPPDPAAHGRSAVNVVVRCQGARAQRADLYVGERGRKRPGSGQERARSDTFFVFRSHVSALPRR